MARRYDDWDELESRSSKKRNRAKREMHKGLSQEEIDDLDYEFREETAFIKNLENKSGKYDWMKERKYKTMFRDIESKLQGVMGEGPFEWVDRRVFDQVFDRLTLLSLYKLMKTGVIDTLDHPIAQGKEAHVFHGTDINGKAVAVKIFHTSNAVFKNLLQYIEGDPRFGGLKRRHRDIVDIWVRKEYRNLLRLHKWGLNVPEPLAVNKNVLVMDFIGNEISHARRLRDSEIPNPKAVYEELVEFLAVAWQKSSMVHGDFSPYNILWWGDRPVVIDVGQAVVDSHPRAQEFLVRDVTRLVQWAQKMGVECDVTETLLDVLEMDLSHLSSD